MEGKLNIAILQNLVVIYYRSNEENLTPSSLRDPSVKPL